MNLETAGTVVDLTSGTVDRLKETRICIVNFWALGCAPCRKLAPIFEEVSAEISAKRSGQVAFFKVNVEEEPDLADAYGITSIPTVIGFVDGKPLDRFSSKRTKEELVRRIEKLAGNGWGS